jgi:hypothetical protein
MGRKKGEGRKKGAHFRSRITGLGSSFYFRRSEIGEPGEADSVDYRVVAVPEDPEVLERETGIEPATFSLGS